jgi:hypothetical protein
MTNYSRTLQPHKPASPIGRHCWVCGKVGGAGFTYALLIAGYDVPKGQIGYAHHNCMARANRKAASQSDASAESKP